MPVIIFHHRRIRKLGVRMARLIRGADPDTVIDMRENEGDLKHALIKLNARAITPMVVLMIDRAGQIDKFIEQLQCFDGTRLILVLPDSHPDTIARGHRLFPRFITYLDSDWREIAAIVEKQRRAPTAAVSPSRHGISLSPSTADPEGV